MADVPQQDRKLGLPRERVGSKFFTAYDPGVALKMVEQIAMGKTVLELTSCDDCGFPSRATFYRWATQNPELAKALAAARELSAYSLEDEAIGLARELRLFPESTTKIRAFEVAMNQFRWSAARRNPREYSDKGNTNIVVPITINTPLDLGGGPQVGSAALPNVYTITASLPSPEATEDAQFTEDPPEDPAAPQPPPLIAVPEKGTKLVKTKRKPRRAKFLTAEQMKANRSKYNDK